MRFGLAVLMLVLAGSAGVGAPLPPSRPALAPPEVPLPVPRPEVAGPPMPPATTVRSEVFGPPWLPPSAASASVPDPSCRRVLDSGKLVGVSVARIVGAGGCGVEAPLRVEAVVLPNGRRVLLEPPALVRCDLAEGLADWVREDVASIPTPHGDLLGVVDAAGYDCRGRNRVAGARLSEHARGNALDILAFRYATHVVGLKDPAARSLLAQVNHTACNRFSTVLGPGSDGYHEDNLHLDLEIRKNGSHYCHWEQN